MRYELVNGGHVDLKSDFNHGDGWISNGKRGEYGDVRVNLAHVVCVRPIPPAPEPPDAGKLITRALLDKDGDLWTERGNGLWDMGTRRIPGTMERERVEREFGPVREVMIYEA